MSELFMYAYSLQHNLMFGVKLETLFLSFAAEESYVRTCL